MVRDNYAEFTALLRPHLAPTEPADSVEETLSSPQLRQAVGQLAAALNSQNAEQIFAELNLRPQSAGVLGFIEAVQQQADATVRAARLAARAGPAEPGRARAVPSAHANTARARPLLRATCAAQGAAAPASDNMDTS